MTPHPAHANRWLSAAGAGAVVLFIAMVLRFWHPVFGFTEFIQLGASPDKARIAAFQDARVYAYPYPGSYDGIAYAQIAADPLLRSPGLRSTVDNLSYRARRIAPPAAAWMLALGNPTRIIPVYSILNAGVWLLLAIILWRLLPVRDARSWIAWAGVLFSAGALASVRLALTDLPALAALAMGMLALERNRRGGAVGWLALAALCRETSLAALPAFWRNRRMTPLLAVVPLALWMAYLRWHLGPADAGWGNFAPPVVGFAAKWRDAFSGVWDPAAGVLQLTTLLATLGLTVQGAYFAITARRDSLRDPWWRLGAVFTAMMLVLGSAVWAGDPGAATRVLLPLGLAFNVLACRRRAPILLLILGNLMVPAGLLCLKDLPPHPNEIVASRTGGVTVIARLGEGWHPIEHTLKHTRTWCSGKGELDVETWPRDDRVLRLEFTCRSLTPRTVTVSENGAVLWHGSVGTSYVPVSLSFPTSAGGAVLHFSTDSPGVITGSGSYTPVLAFAMRDPKIGPK